MRPRSLRSWISRGYVPKTQIMLGLGDEMPPKASSTCSRAGLRLNLRLIEPIFILGGEVKRNS
jgi:hypothetical protein